MTLKEKADPFSLLPFVSLRFGRNLLEPQPGCKVAINRQWKSPGWVTEQAFAFGSKTGQAGSEGGQSRGRVV